MQSREQQRKAPRPNRLELQRQSIMEIKRNVESIKQKNEAHRRQLQQFFLARSHVQQPTYVSLQARNPIRPPMLRPDNPQQQPQKISPKFRPAERRKTQQYDPVRRPNLGNRTLLLNSSVQEPPPVQHRETETQTVEERPFRSDSIQQINLAFVAKKQDLISVVDRSHNNLYNNQIDIFERHYEVLNDLMSSLRKKLRVLQQCLFEFVSSVPNLGFIDDFISEYQPSGQRILRTSRILELVSVLYIVVEMSKGTVMDNYNSLVNAMGYTAANLIFIAKLHIMREGSSNLNSSRFEEAIERFEKTAYYEQLTDERDILLRMQHNNDILSKIELQLSATNVKFQARIKQFVKGYHREQYSYGLAYIFLFEYLSYYLHENGLDGITPFLDVAPHPYLPPPPIYKKYLVVIEPLNVLVWERNNRCYVRPYTHELLAFISEHAEVLLWTHAMPKEIEELLDLIDSRRKAEYRLFRYHCVQSPEGLPIKDPNRLGRPLENIFMIDYDRKNVQPGFGNILELFWKGSKRDRKLLTFNELLADMFRTRCSFSDFVTVRGRELRGLQTLPSRRFPSKTLKLPINRNHFLHL